MTQKERVLWYLRTHGELTPKTAENELGIGRLAARIYDLRQEGYPIETDKREVEGRFGTAKVAFYSLEEG
jgi:biotin operon repressor